MASSRLVGTLGAVIAGLLDAGAEQRGDGRDQLRVVGATQAHRWTVEDLVHERARDRVELVDGQVGMQAQGPLQLLLTDTLDVLSHRTQGRLVARDLEARVEQRSQPLSEAIPALGLGRRRALTLDEGGEVDYRRID